MDKEEAGAFENLWKVKAIRNHQKLLKEEGLNGKVTRTEKADFQRLIKFMKYAFEEGVKKGARK